jgi:hypothetical protein
LIFTFIIRYTIIYSFSTFLHTHKKKIENLLLSDIPITKIIQQLTLQKLQSLYFIEPWHTQTKTPSAKLPSFSGTCKCTKNPGTAGKMVCSYTSLSFNSTNSTTSASHLTPNLQHLSKIYHLGYKPKLSSWFMTRTKTHSHTGHTTTNLLHTLNQYSNTHIFY